MKKIKLKLNKPISLKLQFVKLIKDYTNLGLKESKAVCDELHQDLNKIVEIEIPNNKDIKEFIKELKNHFNEDISVNGGIEFIRNHNLLILGIGEKEDYINHILDWGDYDGKEKFLKRILEFVTKEDLQKILLEMKII
jgi:hypothetical protein